jgi:hypothetical protein
MSKSILQFVSEMRGLYKRVADQLEVDPSYVSRVSRGERRSPKIEALLKREVSKFLKFASRRAQVKKT